jgi:hypothetical protein
MLTIEYTQRPPNDLIGILGGLLEANWNSQQRREERIAITPENIKKLGMESRDAVLFIGETQRPCILRDLSFIGAEVLTSRLTESDAGRPISLRIAKGEQAADMTLQGTITRVEEVGGRKDIKAVAIEYASDTPISYKLLINSFITSSRKAPREGEPGQVPGPVPGRPDELKPEDSAPPPDSQPTDVRPIEPFLPSPPHPRRGPEPEGESSPNG